MNRLIISFTSIPARIDSVKTVLNSLYQQTLHADKIILWLAEELFPKREADLPTSLQEDIAAKKFSLRWCNDLGSHTKYFYAMQEFLEDIIVTVDDDTFYSQDMLQKLMETHARFPHAVVARTTSLALLDSDFKPLPMCEWLFDFQSFSEPSMFLVAQGVGGVLYPPHSVSRAVLDKECIRDICTVEGKICGDDLLLKAGEMLNKTPVVAVKGEPYFRLPNTQQTALSKIMPNEKHNDLIIQRFKQRFQDSFGEDVVGRLKKDRADFENKDQEYSLCKSYWITRPSRDLCRQIGYLTLPDAPSKPNSSDFKGIKDIARFASKVFTAYPPENSDDKTTKAFLTFRQELLDIPDIADLTKTDVVIRGLIDYGEPLNLECRIIYHGIPIYMRSLKNWRSFMANHPDCEPIFREGYKTFLKNTEAAIKKAETVLSKADIDEWQAEYEKAIIECAITQ